MDLERHHPIFPWYPGALSSLSALVGDLKNAAFDKLRQRSRAGAAFDKLRQRSRAGVAFDKLMPVHSGGVFTPGANGPRGEKPLAI